MTDPRQLEYEAHREAWRRLNGLPGARPGYGGRGENPSAEADDDRLRSQLRIAGAQEERSANKSLPEAANSETIPTAPSTGAAR